jgi:RNA polymerase sigma-70 factor, ECF subfamily
MWINSEKPIVDKLLLEQLKSSNKGAFELVFKYYYSGLVFYCDRFLKDRILAEDIVQTVFMELWEKRRALEIRSFRSYLLHCVKNRCIDYLRTQAVKNKYIGFKLETNQFEIPENFWTKHELEELIQNAIAKLSPRCKEVFLMSRMENMKNAEIADKLHLSGRTVETQITHALKHLRVELSEYLTS